MSRAEPTFRDLVEAHKDAAYRAAFRLLGCREDALDVLQETFLALHRDGADVATERVRAWVLRVATNRAIDRLRGRRGADAEVEPDRWPARVADGPADHAERAEVRHRVAAALDRLSARQREVVLLRVYENESFVRIAERLEITEGACKAHFRRGLETLREVLDTPEEGHPSGGKP